MVSGALIDHNTLYASGSGAGAALAGDGVQNSRIQANVLQGDNNLFGISLYRTNAAAASTGDVIVNNTVVLGIGHAWALSLQNGSTGATVFNNVLFSGVTRYYGSLYVSADSLSELASDQNLVPPKSLPTSRYSPDKSRP